VIPHEDKLIPLLFPSISSSLLSNPIVAGFPRDLNWERREREFSAISLTLEICKKVDVSEEFTKNSTGKTIVFHVLIY
jgi:hypothetical protein